MLTREVIFWDPCVSPHKADFFEAIGKLNLFDRIRVVADSDVTDSRKALGWSSPRNEGYETIIGPDSSFFEAERARGFKSSLHVFSGIRNFNAIKKGLKEVLLSGAPFLILSEPRVAEGISGVARFIQSLAVEGPIRKRCRGVLAIGRNGPAWFSSVGYNPKWIFDFAYFTDGMYVDADSVRVRSSVFKISYVGRLVEEKGVFELLSAISRFPECSFEVDYVGAGPAEQRLKRLASGLPSVRFLGVLPYESIPQYLASVDILVLPSRTTDDGWGVIVNEAIRSGCFVIVSKRAGSSCLLRAGVGLNCGEGEAGNIARSLESVVQEDFSVGRLLGQESRKRRQIWANRALSAAAGAEYFGGIVRHLFEGHPRPLPPWESVSWV